MKIRMSLVHYLNAAPLGWAFMHGPFRELFEVFPSSPAVCADQLAKGAADIGLIPSIEYERIPGLRIVPGMAISSLAAVRSILLVRKIGMRKIESVALDTSSRTSVALTKVLLHGRMAIHPEFVPCNPDAPAMLTRCDAGLIIGDPALKLRIEDYDTIDMAEEWVKWQQRPFVCAFWACRANVQLPAEISHVFEEAKEWGLKRRGEIASAYSASLNLPRKFLEDYLHDNINYDFESRHREGLERFYQLADQEHLIPGFKTPEFLE